MHHKKFTAVWTIFGNNRAQILIEFIIGFSLALCLIAAFQLLAQSGKQRQSTYENYWDFRNSL